MTAIDIIKPLKKNLIELCEFLIPNVRSSAIVPPDFEKATAQVFICMKEGATLVARDDGGVIVGAIGMRERDFWYSNEIFMENLFFYVAPERRFGDVGVKLMMAVRRIAQERGRLCFVLVNDPDRRQRTSAASLYAQIAGFIPQGYVLKLNGGKGDSSDGRQQLEQ